MKLVSRLSAAAMLLPLAACNLEQSALHPKGPHAESIAQLGTILFVIAAVVLIAVVLCTWIAIRGPQAWRAKVARPATIIIGGIVAPLAVLSALLAYNVVLMRGDAVANDALRIEVSGEQWWWRVTYLNGGNRAFATANEVHIPVGREVEFSLVSPDVIHSFWVPSLGGKADMIPGRTNKLRLKADRPGVFRGQCAEYCGGPHALMALPIVALMPDEFERWQSREGGNATDQTAGLERSGRALFLAAGCGGCHAIRGTPAQGAIGPDLTHFGARRSVGVDTLPATRENVIQFITDGQHVKPGNLMPQFRIFSHDEHQALASFLLSLR